MPIFTPKTAFAPVPEPGRTCAASGIPVATSTSSALQPIGRQRCPSVAHRDLARLAGQLADRRDGDERQRDRAADPDGRGEDVDDDEDHFEPVRHRITNRGVEREDWNRKHGEAGPLFGVEPNRFLVAEVADLPPGRALDVACGAGRNAVWLAERGWTVTGVDFSDVALENARRLAGGARRRRRVGRGDLRDWQPPAEYDLVAVLYLQVPAERAPRRCSRGPPRALAPGGTLLVVGHHSDNLEHGSGGPKDPRVLYTRRGRRRRPRRSRDREGRSGAAPGRGRAGRDRRARPRSPRCLVRRGRPEPRRGFSAAVPSLTGAWTSSSSAATRSIPARGTR